MSPSWLLTLLIPGLGTTLLDDRIGFRFHPATGWTCVVQAAETEIEDGSKKCEARAVYCETATAATEVSLAACPSQGSGGGRLRLWSGKSAVPVATIGLMFFWK